MRALVLVGVLAAGCGPVSPGAPDGTAGKGEGPIGRSKHELDRPWGQLTLEIALASTGATKRGSQARLTFRLHNRSDREQVFWASSWVVRPGTPSRQVRRFMLHIDASRPGVGAARDLLRLSRSIELGEGNILIPVGQSYGGEFSTPTADLPRLFDSYRLRVTLENASGTPARRGPVRRIASNQVVLKLQQ